MTVRLGVLGWPVAHSRSPAMHNAALDALGLRGWHYQLLPVPPRLLAETLRGLPSVGFAGANVTIPHKEAALRAATSASRAAREIGAANTLTFSAGGEVHAENTDAPGLIDALGFSPRGMRALVLGAGGSARAAVWALREAGAAEVSVWNRTPARAAALARDLGVRAVASAVAADLLVNCTSVGLDTTTGQSPGAESAPGVELSATDRGALNQQGLTFDQLGEYANVADLVYRSPSTPLLAAAQAHGARTVDGIEILVCQGARSLRIWTGADPPVEVMREAALRSP